MPGSPVFLLCKFFFKAFCKPKISTEYLFAVDKLLRNPCKTTVLQGFFQNPLWISLWIMWKSHL